MQEMYMRKKMMDRKILWLLGWTAAPGQYMGMVGNFFKMPRLFVLFSQLHQRHRKTNILQTKKTHLHGTTILTLQFGHDGHEAKAIAAAQSSERGKDVAANAETTRRGGTEQLHSNYSAVGDHFSSVPAAIVIT